MNGIVLATGDLAPTARIPIAGSPNCASAAGGSDYGMPRQYGVRANVNF